MNASNPSAPISPEAQRAQLSALCDGDLAALEDGCRLWREDAEARATWHTYHLIGDVLRSEDLAGAGARDAAFLRGLRTRLAAEPVVLAPMPRPARPRRWRWAGPAAVAAGFVAVAGVLTVMRAPVADTGTPIAESAPAVLPPPVVPVVGVEPSEPLASGKLIRDARLDRYLDAHQQFGGTTVLGGQSLVRRATVDAAQR